MSNPSSKASMHAELSRLGASQSEDFRRTLAALSQDWLAEQWLPESAWQEINQLELDVVSLWQTIDDCISLATQLTSGFMPNGWSGRQNEAAAPAQTTAVASGQAAAYRRQISAIGIDHSMYIPPLTCRVTPLT